MISTHILDTSQGHPASDVLVRLEHLVQKNWSPIASEKTDPDGRIRFNCPALAGRFRLTFQISEYFAKTRTASFFPVATIEFEIEDVTRKYHVPLLLNPYGYSTYRGS